MNPATAARARWQRQVRTRPYREGETFATGGGIAAAWLEAAREALPPGGGHLDLGCGEGRMTFALVSRWAGGGWSVGVDRDPAALAAARERARCENLSGARFVQMDVEREEYAPRLEGGATRAHHRPPLHGRRNRRARREGPSPGHGLRLLRPPPRAMEGVRPVQRLCHERGGNRARPRRERPSSPSSSASRKMSSSSPLPRTPSADTLKTERRPASGARTGAGTASGATSRNPAAPSPPGPRSWARPGRFSP